MDYSKFINPIINKEKGYSDHPSDNGGPTNWGITEKVARINGYKGDMRDMPRGVAEDIYKMRYIINPGFASVANVSVTIASELIDTGVNMGPVIAAIFLQRILNVCNARGSKYADLFVDGSIGPATISALKSFLAWRGIEGEDVMVKALNGVQGSRYLDLAEKNESQEDFFYGWIKNRT